jgi:hypothetical protein
MSALTKTQKILGLASILLVVSIGAYYLLFNEIYSMHAKADELRAAAMVATQRTESAKRTAVLVSDTESMRGELNTYLLGVNDPTPLLSLIETFGGTTGVKLEVQSITDTSPSANKNAQNTTPVVQLVIAVEGTFTHVYHLLTLFEHMPYIVSITQVAVSRSSDSDLWTGQISMRIGTKTQN